MAFGGQSSLFPEPDPSGPLDLPDLWLRHAGPQHDVVVSSRMRLARNIERVDVEHGSSAGAG